MIQTAIILAGGLGTRLRSAVADLPKCMAPVAGQPFISFVIAVLQNEGIENFVFSLGYKSEVIIDYIDSTFKDLNKHYVIETKQLGTGGAILEACKVVKEPNVIVVNGDTLFMADIKTLAAFHENTKADCTIALKEMINFDRYGAVEISENNSIIAFKEKQFCSIGCINGGVYALSIQSLLDKNYPEVFSFEKEYLEKNTGNKSLYGLVNKGYFIDIGIPEDYLKFQTDHASIITKNKQLGKEISTQQFLAGITV